MWREKLYVLWNWRWCKATPTTSHMEVLRVLESSVSCTACDLTITKSHEFLNTSMYSPAAVPMTGLYMASHYLLLLSGTRRATFHRSSDHKVHPTTAQNQTSGWNRVVRRFRLRIASVTCQTISPPLSEAITVPRISAVIWRSRRRGATRSSHDVRAALGNLWLDWAIPLTPAADATGNEHVREAYPTWHSTVYDLG